MATTVNGNTVVEAADFKKSDIEVVNSNIATQLAAVAAAVSNNSVITESVSGTAAGAVIALQGDASDGGVQKYFIDEVVTLTNAVETDLTYTLGSGNTFYIGLTNDSMYIKSNPSGKPISSFIGFTIGSYVGQTIGDATSI